MRIKPQLIILLSLFWGFSNGLLFGFSGSNDLITVPSAKMEKMGFTEYGAMFDYRAKTPDSATVYFRTLFYLRWALSDRFEYNLNVQDTMNTLHSFHFAPFVRQNRKKTIQHNIGIGLKNLGWGSIPQIDSAPNIPIMNLFAIYSISSLKFNSNYHIGIASDRIRPNITRVVGGFEKSMLFGTIIAEYDGFSPNLGLKYNLKKARIYLTWTAARPKILDPSHEIRLFSFGVSYASNVLDSLTDLLVGRQEFNSTYDNIDTRLNNLEDVEKTHQLIKQTGFLKDLEETLSDAFEKDGLPKESYPSKRAFVHMQRGLEFYYDEDYQNALKEYLNVVKIVPNSAVGFTRLGSIYFKLKDYKKAKAAWKMALRIDPKNKDIVNYLKQIKKELIRESKKTQKKTKEKKDTPQNKTETIPQQAPISPNKAISN